MRDGLLLIDKHEGVTSHTVVQQVRKTLRQKKIGHCGTLDPAATGLLLLTLGRATRLTRFLIKAPKVYEGTVHLGTTTDTYDAEGEVIEERPVEDYTMPQIESFMEELEGTYPQIPPPYCARKINGKKYYELARQGEEVPKVPKEVSVFEFSAQSEFEDDRIDFRLSCASGTYARTLAFDLGEKLGCGGHLSRLRRTEIGHFLLDDAITAADLAQRVTAGEGRPEKGWIPFDQITLPFFEISADNQQELRINHGQTILVQNLKSEEGDWVKILNGRQRFIAVGTVVERIGQAGVGIVQPKIVFPV